MRWLVAFAILAALAVAPGVLLHALAGHHRSPPVAAKRATSSGAW